MAKHLPIVQICVLICKHTVKKNYLDVKDAIKGIVFFIWLNLIFSKEFLYDNDFENIIRLNLYPNLNSIN